MHVVMSCLPVLSFQLPQSSLLLLIFLCFASPSTLPLPLSNFPRYFIAYTANRMDLRHYKKHPHSPTQYSTPVECLTMLFPALLQPPHYLQIVDPPPDLVISHLNGSVSLLQSWPNDLEMHSIYIHGSYVCVSMPFTDILYDNSANAYCV